MERANVMANRREVVRQGVLLGVTWVAGATCASAAMLTESDPQARALGYVADTRSVDQKRYPKHAVMQRCDNCSLYQGKAGDPVAACPLFAGKQVAAAGWCSAYAKK